LAWLFFLACSLERLPACLDVPQSGKEKGKKVKEWLPPPLSKKARKVGWVSGLEKRKKKETALYHCGIIFLTLLSVNLSSTFFFFSIFSFTFLSLGIVIFILFYFLSLLFYSFYF